MRDWHKIEGGQNKPRLLAGYPGNAVQKEGGGIRGKKWNTLD